MSPSGCTRNLRKTHILHKAHAVPPGEVRAVQASGLCLDRSPWLMFWFPNEQQASRAAKPLSAHCGCFSQAPEHCSQWPGISGDTLLLSTSYVTA